MHVKDFGRMDGKVFLFGGPYSNLQALEAMVRIIGDGDAICTGDVVAYCGDPAQTVALMQSRAIPCIAGNCEQQIATGQDDCGCGFDDGSSCNLLSRGWYPFAKKACNQAAVDWMRGLPDIGVFTHQDRRYAVIHGGVAAVNRFLWPNSPADAFREEIAALEVHTGKVDGVVSGHSGIAFHRVIDGCRWINGGVIGMPPHDGRPETRYAVLSNGDVTIERLAYDHQEAAKAMQVAGLTQGYHDALETGLWPSEDTLPTALRRT
ncbi:MAG: metallophosphoesterase family protein [Paracoccaceae bacterium]|nr:metallophosphoesterase family protein [Paracoccaceae bacterium]